MGSEMGVILTGALMLLLSLYLGWRWQTQALERAKADVLRRRQALHTAIAEAKFWLDGDGQQHHLMMSYQEPWVRDLAEETERVRDDMDRADGRTLGAGILTDEDRKRLHQQGITQKLNALEEQCDQVFSSHPLRASLDWAQYYHTVRMPTRREA